MKPQPIIESATDQFQKLLASNWSEIAKLQHGAKKIRFSVQGTIELGAVSTIVVSLGFGVKEKFSSREEIDVDQMALELDGKKLKRKMAEP